MMSVMGLTKRGLMLLLAMQVATHAIRSKGASRVAQNTSTQLPPLLARYHPRPKNEQDRENGSL